MLKSRIGELIDNSPYKTEYIMEVMKVSRNTISNWRTGKAIPSLEKAYQLSRLLGVTVEDLHEYIPDQIGDNSKKLL
jgi:putative transcriptional regulator